jgi:Cu+-exporting ATPase
MWQSTAETDQKTLLGMIAAVESRSEHPLAAAIVAFTRSNGVSAAVVDRFEALAGRGARGVVNGDDVLVGTESLLTAEGIDVGALADLGRSWAATGRTPVFAAVGGRAVAAFAIEDSLRADAARMVAGLRHRGFRVVMLTGDRRATAEAIARQAGIDEVIAEVLPQGKVDAIRTLQQSGRRVAMVGDGLNDAPALAQAEVGMAMASGTDIAAEAADVTLMRSELASVATALVLARKTMKTMKQNLFWAFIYNIVGIPVAAGLLYPSFGLMLSPVLASAAMAFSSVSVVSNSLRLRRVRLA